MRSRTKIWLACHPQTDWNQRQRYLSHADRPLTAHGESCLSPLAEAVSRVRFQAVLSTGQQRHDAVARAVAESQDGQAIEIDESWRDIDHGLWEGLRFEEVTRQHPQLVRARFADYWNSRAHGGESMADLWQRVAVAWNGVAERRSGKRTLICTSAGVIQLLLCAHLGVAPSRHWQFRIDLASLTYLDCYPAGVIVRKVNMQP